MVKGFTDEKGKFHPTGNNGGKNAPDGKSIEPTGMKIGKQEEKFDLRHDRRKHILTTGEILASRLSLTVEEQQENMERGEEIIDLFQQAIDERDDDFFNGRSVRSFIDTHGADVSDKWIENLGRDEDQFKEFLDNRLEKRKGEWNLAVPIPTDGAFEDQLASNYTTKSYKGRIWWAKIKPEVFLELASPVGTFTEDAVSKYQDSIRTAQPVSTPQLDLSWDDDSKKWKVSSHEGRHRSQASVKEGLSEIPVWLETRREIWEMTEEQENQLKDIIANGITSDSFIPEPTN